MAEQHLPCSSHATCTQATATLWDCQHYQRDAWGLCSCSAGHPSSSQGVQVLCWGKVGKAAQVLRPPGSPQEDDYDSVLRVSTVPDPAAPCGTQFRGYVIYHFIIIVM